MLSFTTNIVVKQSKETIEGPNDMKNKTPKPETDEQQEWLQEIIIENTPMWAHFLAMLSQWRGMRWMHVFPLPLVRLLTDVSVKTDTDMQNPGKGFRPGTLLATQNVRVFKRGKMIAQKRFKQSKIINSPFSKLV